MSCAPYINPDENGFCFNKQGLIRYIYDYNKTYPKSKIDIKNINNLSREILIEKIKTKMEPICGNGNDMEICWANQSFAQHDKIIQHFFKPIRPKTPYQWLSTRDIDDVLEQYAIKYNDFAFLGAVPLDFDDIIEEYKNIDICGLYNGNGLSLSGETKFVGKNIRKIGFVFNLDPSTKGGSHWVCAYLDLNNKSLIYFDSVGNKPPIQIQKFLKKLVSQVERCLNFHVRTKYNLVQHQRGGSECGMYCIFFIYKMLKGHSFEEISANRISDEKVWKFRELFFRPNMSS